MYVVFPVNGFAYTYSRQHSGIPADEYDFCDPDMIAINRNKPADIWDDQVAKDFITDNEFQQTNLKWALEDGVDVWFRGKYIAFSYEIWGDDIRTELGTF